MMPQEIDAVITKKYPNSQRGDDDYFAYFPTTWSQVTNGLSAEKTKEYEELAHQWNAVGVPANVKAA
jgi:hypothetical protein